MTTNIMIVGVGGQGTLVTSRILGGIALEKGYDVKLSEVHGMAQRGGSVVTYVRFGDKVYEPIVEEESADILIAFERLEAARYAHFLKKGGVMIVNDIVMEPITVLSGAAEYPYDVLSQLEGKYKICRLDAGALALGLGNSRVFNSVVLGAAAKYLGVETEVWLKVIEKTVPPKTIDINKKAFLLGLESGETK